MKTKDCTCGSSHVTATNTGWWTVKCNVCGKSTGYHRLLIHAERAWNRMIDKEGKERIPMYLEVNLPDDRYCNGCPACNEPHMVDPYCSALRPIGRMKRETGFAGGESINIIRPSWCPLKEERVCEWKVEDEVYVTGCNVAYVPFEVRGSKFCPNCGGKIVEVKDD